jgi:hypothetical protein
VNSAAKRMCQEGNRLIGQDRFRPVQRPRFFDAVDVEPFTELSRAHPVLVQHPAEARELVVLHQVVAFLRIVERHKDDEAVNNLPVLQDELRKAVLCKNFH